MTMKALIVGGGIGGLTAALALLRRDIDVTVFERTEELKEIGAGVNLSPNASGALFGLGLRDVLMSTGVRCIQREFRVWNSGESCTLSEHGLNSEPRYGAPYMHIHRGDLHSALVQAVRAMKPDAIMTGAACTGITNEDHSAQVKLAGGPVFEGDAVVGADGVHSAVRQALLGPIHSEFNGRMFWRGLVPIDVVPESQRESSCGWLSPSAKATIYPVRAGKLLNFVGTVPRADWSRLSWTEEGAVEECLADFAGWHQDVLEIIRNIETPYKWGAFKFSIADRWSTDRVTLLGDACHPMTPSIGQGAAMAIEDGVVLARCLSETPSVELGLAAYERVRKARTTAVVERSWQESKERHDIALGSSTGAISHMKMRYSPLEVARTWDWIFDYDAHNVEL